jgi:hypothetical protein
MPREADGKISHHYVARAGHLAVMAEFAWRGYNIAIPEIDVGDDVFVVNDKSGAMWRLQAKAASPKFQKHSTCFQFKVRQSSINRAQSPELHFIFALRTNMGWRYVVMDRSVLRTYVSTKNIGTPADGGVFRRLDIVLHDDGRATCAKQDWTVHLEDWSTWPTIEKEIKNTQKKTM